MHGSGLRERDVVMLMRVRVCHHNSLFYLWLLNPCLLHIRETAAVFMFETLDY